VVPNRYEFLFSEHKETYTLKNVIKQLMSPLTSVVFFFCPTIEVSGVHQLSGYRHSSKYLLLCSTEERNEYRFGKFILKWTIPLTQAQHLFYIYVCSYSLSFSLQQCFCFRCNKNKNRKKAAPSKLLMQDVTDLWTDELASAVASFDHFTAPIELMLLL